MILVSRYSIFIGRRGDYFVELVVCFSAPGIQFLLDKVVITELSMLCDSLLMVFNFYWKKG